MSQRIGLGMLAAGIDKHFDKIPDKYFNTDTYDPRVKGKKDNIKDNSSRRSSSDRRSRPIKDRNDTAAKGGAIAGGAAAADAANDEKDDRRRHSESNDGHSSQNDRDNWRYPHDYASQGYPQQDPRTQGQHASYSQGDPTFPAQAASLNPPYYPPQEPTYIPYNPYDRSSSLVQGDPNFGRQQNSTNQSPSMGDNYYPPPPPQGSGSGSAGGYHRYNPADYQPRDSYSPSGATHGDRYPSSRNQLDPYQRPSSSNYQGQDNHHHFGDDANGDERYDREEREGRIERRKSQSHRKKSRSRSRGGNPIVGGMHKHLDPTEKGLTAGAIGALAGGLIGHKFGKSPLTTAAGVVLGGFGANAWEARDGRNKDEKHRREKEKMAHRRARSEGPSSSQSHRYDGRRDGAASDYDSEEEEEAYQRRKDAERRARRSRRDSRDYE